MTLKDLQQGQEITCRFGRSGGGDATGPAWGPWHTAKIAYLVRREKPLPAKLRARSNAPDAGDLLTLVVEGWAAEYGQGDYCGAGLFLVEDYYLEIQGL